VSFSGQLEGGAPTKLPPCSFLLPAPSTLQDEPCRPLPPFPPPGIHLLSPPPFRSGRRPLPSNHGEPVPLSSASCSSHFLLITQSDSASHISSDSDKVKVALHADYFKSHLCDIPSLEMEVSKDQLVNMYKEMVTMRRMEMAADQASSAHQSIKIHTDPPAAPNSCTRR
jgi:hypothetical protein